MRFQYLAKNQLKIFQGCVVDKVFKELHTECDWLSWLGQPLLYDAGLFVNRTKEDHEYIDLYRNKIINVVD